MSFSKGFAKTKEVAKKAVTTVKKEIPMRPADVSHEQWYNMLAKKGLK